MVILTIMTDPEQKLNELLQEIKQVFNVANATLAKQQEISEAEFYEQFASIVERETAEELWKSKGWETKRVLRKIISVLMEYPELRQKIEDKGFTLGEIIKLTSVNLLPNAENAVIDIRKLRDYSLNLAHPKGKDKARLFLSILGMTAGNAEELRQIILEEVKTQEVSLNRRDKFGQRYTIDFTLEWQNKSATIRTGWIIEPDSDIPRLTSCYPVV